MEAEVRRPEEAMERYFNAFETGKINEDLCRPRIEALAERLRGLRSRQSELATIIEEEDLAGPSPQELETLEGQDPQRHPAWLCCQHHLRQFGSGREGPQPLSRYRQQSPPDLGRRQPETR